MMFSLSLSGLGENVESDGQVHIAPGMDVCDAAHLIAQNAQGGVAVLATRMGVNAGTLQNKLNPNVTTHHLTLKESVTLQVAANNAAVLHAMAQQLGYSCIRVMPHQDGGDPVEAFMLLQAQFAEFTKASADPLHGKPSVSRNELRRAKAMGNELIEKVGAMVAALAARMPQDQGQD